MYTPTHLDLTSRPMNVSLSPRLLVFGFLLLGGLVPLGCRPSSMMEQAARYADSVDSDPTAISLAKFQETVNQDKIVVLKFGATWCGPCVKVDKELGRLADEMGEQIEVLKVDVDQNQDLASRYQVSSIPRIFLVKNGEILGDEIGYQSKDDLRNWIRQVGL